MNDKICIVTGANAGIGFATAQGLAHAGATVVFLCRDSERGLAAVDRIRNSTGNKNLHLIPGDLSSQRSIRAFVVQFQRKFPRLDILVNNAAILTESRIESTDGLELQFATNYLGMFLLTNLLTETLEASQSSRVINVSTSNHADVSLNIDDLQSKIDYDPKLVHIRTKLAVILFTYEYARRVANSAITANCLNPGVIATNLLGQFRNIPVCDRFTPKMGGDSLEAGAETILYLATSPAVDGVSAQYFDNCQPIQSSPESCDVTLAQNLWRMSEALVDEHSPA